MDKKRRADIQISKDGVGRDLSDDDDGSEEGGLEEGIPRASVEVLQQRRRVTVKKQFTNALSAPDASEAPKAANPFSGITFSNKSIFASTAPASNATEAAKTTETKEEKQTTPDPVATEENAAPAPPTTSAFGFSAYSGSNPFAAIAAKASPKSNPFSSPNPSKNPFMSFASDTNSIWAAAKTKTGTSQQIIQQDASAEGDENDDEKDNVEEEQPIVGEPPATAALFKSDVEIKTGEEGEECSFQLRAKLFRLGTKASAADKEKRAPEWIEVGVGPVRVLKPKPASDEDTTPRPAAARLVMRRENQPFGQGTKLLLNVLLKGRVTAASGGDKAVRLTCVELQEPEDSTETQRRPVVVSYMFRAKSQTEAADLLTALNSVIST